ncbi:MAG: DUF3071 domain-containing protein [Actinomycetales bacterium]|nr:DUF3071 domain-containing protein [Actinomycetales bacterium]
MDELELVGLHDDGEHVVLTGPDGERFKLRIDETLRAAVRRDRPRLELLRAEGGTALPPREIQARIRAGGTAEEVAESGGIAVELVRRYEGPVLAEREFVAGQARASRVGREKDSPQLGELVLDRLAARGVDPDTVSWDSYRAGSDPWTVVVHFVVGSEERQARWAFDHAARSLDALEDEARWLSETQLADEPIPRRHLAAVRDVVFDVRAGELDGPVLTPHELDEPEPDEEPQEDPTHALLDELNGKRGVRQEIELDPAEEEFEGFGPQHAFDFGEGQLFGAHPAHSDPESATDARVLTLPSAASPEQPAYTQPALDEAALDEIEDEPADDVPADEDPAAQDDASPEAAPETQRPRSRKGRASVPSWDEIVFGARRD